MYLLPLYFQSIRGASPISSGIRMLPLILAMTFTSITAATYITKFGMPTYVMMIGAVLACIGSGLVYTFEITTPSSKWIGYLVLLGFGYGFTLQLGIIVGQASSQPEDIAVTTAAINCNPHVLILANLQLLKHTVELSSSPSHKTSSRINSFKASRAASLASILN